jgi:alkanesulfonate monooxygenase SsuD/methylene tetrahydromethanopterin reductase-like flavin-dependent oxidoreductase (luciferase family)
LAEPQLKFGVFYDFRNPRQFRQDWTERYRQTFEQMDWVDRESRFDEVSVSEHHFDEDGDTPSVLPLATAIAARTERVGIATNIVQMPLHHPLNVAEDALTIDALSGGRFRLGLGIGYREEEFAGFGTTLRKRASRMEESIAILRRAFAGEPFSHEGKNWSFPELKVTPLPVREGGPPIWIGGSAKLALERAARLADGYLGSTDELVSEYLELCEEFCVPAAERRTQRVPWTVVAEDPERALRDLGPYMLHQVNLYIEWGLTFLGDKPFTDAQELLDAGLYTMFDAAGAIDYFRRSAEAGVQEIQLFAQAPGEPIATGFERLRYVSDHVIPAFQGGSE